MTLSAIAIDDEPFALEVVKMHAEKVPFLILESAFTNCFDAIPYIKNNKIDLLFLDINMPDLSGIEFVNVLPKCPMVIFTTAYSEYAVKGFELDAVDYLLKPFSIARFTKSCNKALEIKSLNFSVIPEFIFVKTGYEEERVMLSDIQYIVSDGNYLTYILSHRKLLCRQNISDCLAVLPNNQFVRIHRSFIIALKKIEKIAKNSLWIAGKEIPIGASYEHILVQIRKELNL